MRRFASSPKLASAQKPILERAAERLIEAGVREAVIPKRTAELVQVGRDIVRLREDVRALGRSRASAAQRIAERLLAAEDRGRALRVRIAELKAEARERRGQAKSRSCGARGRQVARLVRRIERRSAEKRNAPRRLAAPGALRPRARLARALSMGVE